MASATPLQPSLAPRWQAALPWLALLLITLALSAPAWVLPLQRDQGVYAACGSFLANGQPPYLSCWDTKGPLTHYTYALSQTLFGVTLFGPHMLNALWAAVTGMVLVRVMQAQTPNHNHRHTWLLGLLYAALLVTFPFDMNAQTEGFANLPLLLGALLLVQARSSGDRRGYLLGGALLGLAGLYKYTLLLLGAGIGVACWLTLPADVRRNTRHWLTLAALGGAGTLLVWLVFSLFLAAQGAFGLLVEHLHFMLVYFPRVQVNPELLLFPGESGPPLFYWQRTLSELLRLPAVYGLGLIGLTLLATRREPAALPVWVWVATATFTVFAQRVFTLYHWMLLLPPMIFGIAVLWGQVKQHPWAKALIVLALVVNVGWRWQADTWQLVGPYLSGEIDQRTLFTSQAVQDEIDIAEYIAERTTPEDYIYVWGNHSVIYYLAERRAPTRFIFNSPLMALLGPNPYQPAWLAEVLAGLYANPPTYLVVTWYDMTWFDYITPVQQIEAMPDYQHFVDTYYVRETFYERFAIHRLVPWYSRQTQPALIDAITVVDLLAELPNAVQSPAPNAPIEIRQFEMPGEPPYETLFLHPEGAVAYTISLPDAPVCLRADLALDPISWGWGSDGVTFSVAINGTEVDAVTIGNTPADQRWHPWLVDLSDWAGQTVQLALRTGPGAAIDFTGDQAGWGTPRIVLAPGPTCAANALIIPGQQPPPISP